MHRTSLFVVGAVATAGAVGFVTTVLEMNPESDELVQWSAVSDAKRRRQRETHDSEEEEEAVHDAECKARFEHGTVLVEVDEWVGRVSCEIAERSQADEYWLGGGGKVGAIGLGDATELIDARD